MVEQSHMLMAIREDIRDIRDDIRDLSQRLDGQGHRLDDQGHRLDERIDRLGQSLNDKMSRQFLWLVGIQVTTFLVIVSAILARG
ncbi:MAG: hypothetical protein ACRD2X_16650 [Vicinamibacteraceae bacterium]